MKKIFLILVAIIFAISLTGMSIADEKEDAQKEMEKKQEDMQKKRD